LTLGAEKYDPAAIITRLLSPKQGSEIALTLGAGKYDAITTKVREQTGAFGCILLVVEGDQGSGFSVQAPLSIQMQLPEVLRAMADSIEKDLKDGGLKP